MAPPDDQDAPYELGIHRPVPRSGWKGLLRSLLLGSRTRRILARGGDVDRLPDAVVRTRQRLFGLEATLALQARGRAPRGRVVFRAQHGEDSLLWDLLDGPTEGLYVECGAFDGLTFSVTSGFDAVGWDGLLVEAIPARYAECVQNRPHAVVRHAALCAPGHPPTVQFTHVPGGEHGMLSHAATTHAQRTRCSALARELVTVPAATMDSLLEEHFPDRRLDAAVIDVEGGEVELLRGFSLAKWAPRVLIIEDNALVDDTPLGHAMADQPFVHVGWLDANRVYVHRDERAILDRVAGR